jgi:arylsulfatase A-like enzyme
VHGFDEFFGYLYHLDAMEDPCHRNYPERLKDQVGPRNMVHCWATDVDDPTEQPRWGKIGKQKIEDAGPLCPERMETVDDEILSDALKFADKAKTAGKIENGTVSGLDWFPTFVAAAGDPSIADELKKGKQLGDRAYKVHLDGYDQTDMLTGKGPSKRHEIFYITETTLSAVRIDDFKYRFTDQPNGWLGATVKVDWPILTNLRLDPFERTGMPKNDGGSLAFYNWFVYEFWRFVFVQQEVARAAQTLIEFPPMQKGASFNMEAVKEQIQKALQSHSGS